MLVPITDCFCSIQFALGNVPPLLYEQATYGIFALGPRLGETSFSNPSSPYRGQTDKLFPTIYDQLQLHGYTKRRAFSFYLNGQGAPTGSLIFGGIDTTKYSGGLTSLPVQPFLGSDLFQSWAIALTSVSRVSGGHKTALTPANYSIAAILDSGPPSMYLPAPLVSDIQENMGVTIVNQSYPYAPCSKRHATDTLEMGIGGDNGPKMKIPYSSLLEPHGEPAARGPVSINGTKYCFFGVIATPGPVYLLGETFQRQAYLVFDVDNERVAIAQAKHGVKEENVVEIPKGTGLPGVTSTNTYMLPTATGMAG